MKQEGATEVEILREEVKACDDIIDSLPVGPHDMGVHFWCSPKYCGIVAEDDEEE
jgi:hypothetical protein